MYKPKPTMPCAMPPARGPLKALCLNASLKHERETSNTGELAALVLDHLREHDVEGHTVRLADRHLPVGLRYREAGEDDWPGIVAELKATDIVLFATPVWWGGRSSLMQRVIERMDALDEEYRADGRSALYNKVAGIVITGSEDGALATMGSIMMVLTWMGFTLPPECAAYWVGEVGQPPSEDRAKRLVNQATAHMAANLARNLVYYARLLKEHPLVPAAS
ncbi:MAG TPA: NAD(P)H-dependent oxidoreductase [Candidatus Binatia bacterium]|nr:NAD(P)H-dependent oxidoreductase [Candidatus Binatia bacterium]